MNIIIIIIIVINQCYAQHVYAKTNVIKRITSIKVQIFANIATTCEIVVHILKSPR